MSYSASEMLARFSTQVGVPAALLQRVRGRWRFAGQTGDPTPVVDPAILVPGTGTSEVSVGERFCTGLVVDRVADWLLLLPGSKEQ